MSDRDSSDEYARRMHRVLEHIDRHLDEQLELDGLASVTNFSSFHFHRRFTAWMGETQGDYVRRRRLETAAQRGSRGRHSAPPAEFRLRYACPAPGLDQQIPLAIAHQLNAKYVLIRQAATSRTRRTACPARQLQSETIDVTAHEASSELERADHYDRSAILNSRPPYP